ncbi:MAG: endonuclease III [Bacteroidetes bacterium]|nr:endonuclease III [Bacteroidota bacterium]
MNATTKRWETILQPLLKIYGSRKHPLAYRNVYELTIMIVLSAQTTDALINSIAPTLFEKYPSFKSLAQATPSELYPFIQSVRGYRKKAEWIIAIAKSLANKQEYPRSIEELTSLPGIGRKTANVILRELGAPPQGIFIDLHVARVVPRLGITSETKPEKIEKALMSVLPQHLWHDAGMAFSYLGREVCRPKNPHCDNCPLFQHCAWYKDNKKS